MRRLDTLLVLAHEPITAKLIRELVGDAMAREVIVIDNPGTAMGVINNNAIDAVVMEAAFPGSVGKTGVETFREVLSDIPISRCPNTTPINAMGIANMTMSGSSQLSN